VTFHFRAAPLLELRRARLDSARAALARAHHQFAAASRDVDEAAAALRDANTTYRSALRTGGTVTLFERHRNWMTERQRHLDRQRTALAEHRVVVAAATADVSKAHRDVRILERLRDRLWRRHRLALARRDAKELDLWATLQHSRRQTERGMHS